MREHWKMFGVELTYEVRVVSTQSHVVVGAQRHVPRLQSHLLTYRTSNVYTQIF